MTDTSPDVARRFREQMGCSMHAAAQALVRASVLEKDPQASPIADAVSDAPLRRSLLAALGGRRPFRRFKDALAARPSERDRWYAFHGSRVREGMRQWLTDDDIEPTAPPPRPGGTD